MLFLRVITRTWTIAPRIAVKDEPMTSWHIPRKMAGSRTFTLRQLLAISSTRSPLCWITLEDVTSALTNADPENLSGIYFKQDLTNIPILFSPTKSIMRQSELYHAFLFSLKLPGRRCISWHLQCHRWYWVSSFLFKSQQHINKQLMEGTAFSHKFIFMHN